jgi:hypothetical protein
MFDFPRVQLLFLAGLNLLLYAFLVFRQKKGHLIFLFLLLCVIIFQSIRIFPYTPLASYQVLYSDRKPSNPSGSETSCKGCHAWQPFYFL